MQQHRTYVIMNRGKTCSHESCLRHVYAKDLCRKHYNLKRWHSDYEVERKRIARIEGREMPRRGPQLKTREEREALLAKIEAARLIVGTGKCEMEGCCNISYGRIGICAKHYQRERLLRDQLGMPPRKDERVSPGNVTQRTANARARRVNVTELDIRREAARRGVPPGKVAMEMGVAW